jgi:hypothetical protein
VKRFLFAAAALVMAAAAAIGTNVARPGALPGASDRPASQPARITLSAAQCAGLRHGLHDAAAGCTIIESLHVVSKTVSLDADVYYNAYLQACAAETSGSSCNTSKWWVKDWFAFTTNGNTQIWDNGTPRCEANGTSVTWCSYTGNGTYTLTEGFNFGNNGYARMDIYPDSSCDLRTNSYSIPYGGKTNVYDGLVTEVCTGAVPI